MQVPCVRGVALKNLIISAVFLYMIHHILSLVSLEKFFASFCLDSFKGPETFGLATTFVVRNTAEFVRISYISKIATDHAISRHIFMNIHQRDGN